MIVFVAKLLDPLSFTLQTYWLSRFVLASLELQISFPVDPQIYINTSVALFRSKYTRFFPPFFLSLRAVIFESVLS